LIYWGCLDPLNIFDSNDETGPSVNLWGVDYSIENTTELDLRYNHLTGEIPSEIGNLTNLTKLNLRNNQLTGSIPSEIGNLTNLTYLSLYKNDLTGSIPPEIGNLTNLTELRLDNNQLTGSIPPEIGNLTNLEVLYLFENQLSGEIPESVCDLSNLDYSVYFNGSLVSEGIHFYTYMNQLCPPYPSCIEDYVGEQDISNCWDCEQDGVVELWGVCYSIEYTTVLNLSNRGLTGEIPSEIGTLTNLTSLNLSDNSLTGSIPSEVGNLTNLTLLNLGFNQLTGVIPESICELTNLTWYITSFGDFTPTSFVGSNQLCPPYPSCLQGNYTINGLVSPIVGNQDTSDCD
jgi:Leucine-rich repeat (LRR) protein